MSWALRAADRVYGLWEWYRALRSLRRILAVMTALALVVLR